MLWAAGDAGHRAPIHRDGRADVVSRGKTGTALVTYGDSRRREVTERAQWQSEEADGQFRGEAWSVPDGAAGVPLEDGALNGEVYDWYQRGVQMLDSGNP